MPAWINEKHLVYLCWDTGKKVGEEEREIENEKKTNKRIGRCYEMKERQMR